ncbi:hypothetical protein DFH09DRAFT_1083397 [Mycena vulgaris]|nr:hypothetical protein DFH09DRAFT_1083397 [Mycena vulgaris]
MTDADTAFAGSQLQNVALSSSGLFSGSSSAATIAATSFVTGSSRGESHLVPADIPLPEMSPAAILAELSKRRVEVGVHESEPPAMKQRRERTCRKCAVPECPGRGNVKSCRNRCRDCGKAGQDFSCKGRDSKKPNITCTGSRVAWVLRAARESECSGAAAPRVVRKRDKARIGRDKREEARDGRGECRTVPVIYECSDAVAGSERHRRGEEAHDAGLTTSPPILTSEECGAVDDASAQDVSHEAAVESWETGLAVTSHVSDLSSYEGGACWDLLGQCLTVDQLSTRCLLDAPESRAERNLTRDTREPEREPERDQRKGKPTSG